MTKAIDYTADIIDVRDVIARYEELEAELADLGEAEADNLTVSDAYHDAHCEHLDLTNLLADLKGNGGDEKWRGDWYPVTLIRESHFEDSMDEMIADCYNLDALKLPAFITLGIDYLALRMDYTSTEIDGVTYLYR